MTDQSDAPSRVVYFDTVSASGALNGVVQVELVANTLDTIEAGVEVRQPVVARLRCSVPAAELLIASLRNAIDLANRPPEDPPGPAN